MFCGPLIVRFNCLRINQSLAVNTATAVIASGFLVHGHYLVFYREHPGVIEVVRVLDALRRASIDVVANIAASLGP
jgi:hypothetical protein